MYETPPPDPTAGHFLGRGSEYPAPCPYCHRIGCVLMRLWVAPEGPGYYRTECKVCGKERWYDGPDV